MLIDGVLAGTVNNGGQFTVNTARLNDGWHDVRALSYDNTVTKTVGRLVTGFVTRLGHAAGMTATTTIGTLTTNYQFNVTAGAMRARSASFSTGALWVHARAAAQSL